MHYCQAINNTCNLGGSSGPGGQTYLITLLQYFLSYYSCNQHSKLVGWNHIITTPPHLSCHHKAIRQIEYFRLEEYWERIRWTDWLVPAQVEAHILCGFMKAQQDSVEPRGGKMECIFHSIMIGWCLSTPRFAKYQLPISLSISVTHVSAYAPPVAQSNSRIPESPQPPRVPQPISRASVFLDAPSLHPSWKLGASIGGTKQSFLRKLFPCPLCEGHLSSFIYPYTETKNIMSVTFIQMREVDPKENQKPKEKP